MVNQSEVTVVWQAADHFPGAATGLLREAVAPLLGVAPEQVRLSRSCPQCGSSEHGRPVVLPTGGIRPPFVSLSRAPGLMVVAVSPDAQVGVDIESLDAVRFSGFDEVALHPHEFAPTSQTRAITWVRKESLLKATGLGLRVDPRQILLSNPDQPPGLVEWTAPRAPRQHVWMRDLEIGGYAACVTALGGPAPVVRLRREAPVARPR